MRIPVAYKLYYKIYWHSNKNIYIDFKVEIAWKHNSINILWSWSLFVTPFFLNRYFFCCYHTFVAIPKCFIVKHTFVSIPTYYVIYQTFVSIPKCNTLPKII